MSKANNTKEQTERILLVYVNPEPSEDDYAEAELEGLVEAAEGQAVGSIRQRVDRPLKATYVGSGKVIEIKEAAAELAADTVLFDTELSGIQIRNLEEALEKRVIDRTQLILDIFAARAITREGQLQVELAQYSYRLPRLMSVYTKFERQRGGIGMRGPGETKLESDRRMVRNRISKLQAEIDQVKRHRDLQRSARSDSPYPVVSIIGYTSAGKSTLMNSLSHTSLLADAMPFATLDPITRKIDLPDGFSFYLTDTVGFIKNLPTNLVAAFRATLEELIYSDLLLHVVDVSQEDYEIQMQAVDDTVKILKAESIPSITVFNKIDLVEDQTFLRTLIAGTPNSIAVSAMEGKGLSDLLQTIGKHLQDRLSYIKALVPFAHGNLVERAYDFGQIVKKEYREDGIYLEAKLAPEMRGKLAKYEIE